MYRIEMWTMKFLNIKLKLFNICKMTDIANISGSHWSIEQKQTDLLADFIISK